MFFQSVSAGAIPAILTQQFPVRVRSTGMTIGYNISVMFFGGFAPFMMVWLKPHLGKMTPAYYLIACAFVGAIGCVFAREKGK